jgi:hypothetical protein
MSFSSSRNSTVRTFEGGVRASEYWIGNALLSASHIVNNSLVTGATVAQALSNCVYPYEVRSLGEQAILSYDSAVSKWVGRSKEFALKGTGDFSFCVGTFAVAPGIGDIIIGNSAGVSTNTGADNIGI